MLRPRLPDWNWWAGSALGTLILVAIIGSFLTPKYASEPTNQQASSGAENDGGYSVLSLLESVYSYFASLESDTYIAFFTAILTVSTIALWWATKRAAEIAERTLNDLGRPWIFITEISPTGIFQNHPVLEVEITNHGKIVGKVLSVMGGVRASVELDIQVRYRGLTDKIYETAFCVRYDATGKRFRRYGGDKYNYTK